MFSGFKTCAANFLEWADCHQKFEIKKQLKEQPPQIQDVVQVAPTCIHTCVCGSDADAVME